MDSFHLSMSFSYDSYLLYVSPLSSYDNYPPPSYLQLLRRFLPHFIFYHLVRFDTSRGRGYLGNAGCLLSGPDQMEQPRHALDSEYITFFKKDETDTSNRKSSPQEITGGRYILARKWFPACCFPAREKTTS